MVAPFCIALNIHFIRSKGQKIKLVIAACLWNNPQVCPFSNTPGASVSLKRGSGEEATVAYICI